jgi:hypothetical protein
LASSDAWIDPEAARALGRLLTGTEAKGIADRLSDGDTLTAALRVVPAGRRPEIRSLLEPSVSGPLATSPIIAVLRAVEGSRSITTTVDPLWTMPGHLAGTGPLTSSVTYYVANARQSVTCSTFNFQRSSGLWDALRQAAQRPEITVRVYIDTMAADQEPQSWSPTTSQVRAQMQPGAVLRTKEFDGKYVRNHAKFLIIDHRFLLTTSANFSWSAEHGNVEFGLFIDDRGLAEAVEREMHKAEEFLFERVPDARSPS